MKAWKEAKRVDAWFIDVDELGIQTELDLYSDGKTTEESKLVLLEKDFKNETERSLTPGMTADEVIDAAYDWAEDYYTDAIEREWLFVDDYGDVLYTENPDKMFGGILIHLK